MLDTRSITEAESSDKLSQDLRDSIKLAIVFFPGIDLVYSYGAMHI